MAAPKLKKEQVDPVQASDVVVSPTINSFANMQDLAASLSPTEITQTAFNNLTTAQKLALGQYVILPDAAPSGYSVTIDNDPILADGSDSFTFAAAEVGSYYDYSFSSSGGGTPVTGFGVISTATDQITNIDLSGLNAGTVTLTVYLTNATGQGANATDTATISASLLPAPNAGNANPELVTGNALAFGADEVNGTANFAFAGNLTSQLVDDGYVGDYVIRYTVPSDFNSVTTTTLATASGATNYEYAIVVRRVSGTGTLSLRSNINGSNSNVVTGIADTVFTLYDNIGGTAISVPDTQTIALNFLASTSGDVWEIKASLKIAD